VIGGRFDAYAVTTGQGPHVTLQAGVVHLGRYWTTTTRGSVKAASISRLGRAAATAADGSRWRVVGGEALLLDPARLSSFGADPFASALAGGAMFRLGLGRLDQVLGYAEAGAAVPASFLPTGRVLLVTRIRDQLVLDGNDIVAATGQWARSPKDIEPRRRRRSRWEADRVLSGVPDDIAVLAARAARGWLGLQTGPGAVALPADWEPATGRLRVGRGALAAVSAELPGGVCVTLHDSASRRPDEKLGIMLRGTGAVVDIDETAASVALDVDRVTFWRGFVSTTVGQAA
jgi:hypothetical protein